MDMSSVENGYEYTFRCRFHPEAVQFLKHFILKGFLKSEIYIHNVKEILLSI